MEYTRCMHEFGPFYRPDSRILILGSFPSIKSREQKFYYGHPQNRFWKVLAAVCGEEPPQTQAEKEQLLAAHRIALWDVIEECDIRGSSDSSIKNVVPTDLERILSASPVEMICANGKLAGRLLQRYHAAFLEMNHPDIKIHVLPSTSPANAACSLSGLTGVWDGVLHSICGPRSIS